MKNMESIIKAFDIVCFEIEKCGECFECSITSCEYKELFKLLSKFISNNKE